MAVNCNAKKDVPKDVNFTINLYFSNALTVWNDLILNSFAYLLMQRSTFFDRYLFGFVLSISISPWRFARCFSVITETAPLGSMLYFRMINIIFVLPFFQENHPHKGGWYKLYDNFVITIGDLNLPFLYGFLNWIRMRNTSLIITRMIRNDLTNTRQAPYETAVITAHISNGNMYQNVK